MESTSDPHCPAIQVFTYVIPKYFSPCKLHTGFCNKHGLVPVVLRVIANVLDATINRVSRITCRRISRYRRVRMALTDLVPPKCGRRSREIRICNDAVQVDARPCGVGEFRCFDREVSVQNER